MIAQKDNKILQTPVTINRLSLRNLTNDFDKRLVKKIDADFESFDIDEWEVGFINLPLGQPAPAQPGQLFMRVVIKSTDYFGSDLDVNMMMDIKEIPKTKSKGGDIDAQLYGGSDDDDGDNDARMGARGGQGESEDENEDEDELDLELEDDIYSDSSYTDIDTDTEVEEERRRRRTGARKARDNCLKGIEYLRPKTKKKRESEIKVTVLKVCLQFALHIRRTFFVC